MVSLTVHNTLIPQCLADLVRRCHLKVTFLAVLSIFFVVPAFAGDVYWVDVVAYPGIPGWSARHVQILHLHESWDDQDGNTIGRIQHANRLTKKDVKALSEGLQAWLEGSDPPNNTIWSLERQDTTDPGRLVYSLDMVSSLDPDRHATLISTGTSWLTDGRGFCPTCYPTQVFDKEQMTLTEDEAQALTDALNGWLGGQDPADGVIWSKLVER